MRLWAEKASGQLDSKVKRLIEWLNTHIRPGKKWGNERVILFTEYRSTQNWLREILAQQGFTKDDRLLSAALIAEYDRLVADQKLSIGYTAAVVLQSADPYILQEDAPMYD